MPGMGMTGMGMMPGMMPGGMRPGMMPQQMPRPAALRAEADDRREALPYDRQVPAGTGGEDHRHDAGDGQQRAPDPPGVRGADEGQGRRGPSRAGHQQVRRR